MCHGMGEVRKVRKVKSSDAETIINYRGDFDSGTITGTGTIHYGDGSSYLGSIVNGVPHGDGVSTHHDESKAFGNFLRDTPARGYPVGNCAIYFPESCIFQIGYNLPGGDFDSDYHVAVDLADNFVTETVLGHQI